MRQRKHYFQTPVYTYVKLKQMYLDFLLTRSGEQKIIHLCFKCVINFDIDVIAGCLFLISAFHTTVTSTKRDSQQTFQIKQENLNTLLNG